MATLSEGAMLKRLWCTCEVWSPFQGYLGGSACYDVDTSASVIRERATHGSQWTGAYDVGSRAIRPGALEEILLP